MTYIVPTIPNKAKNKQINQLRNLNPKHVERDLPQFQFTHKYSVETETPQKAHVRSSSSSCDRQGKQTNPHTHSTRTQSQLARRDLSHKYCAGIRLRLLPLLHICTSPTLLARSKPVLGSVRAVCSHLRILSRYKQKQYVICDVFTCTPYSVLRKPLSLQL